MFFRQQWKDHRLVHGLNQTLTIIVGTKHPSDIIWTPDTVFINSVTSAMHHVTVNNHKLDIYPDGTVFWGTRVTVSPSCYLDLKAYPMDKQTCDFKIVSYAYDSRHLKYKWKEIEKPLLITRKEMAQFQLTGFSTKEEEINYVAGNYTVLTGTFHFKRLMGFAILQIYIPSIAIVCVSWISLWVRRGATPARVSLCITTLLTISTIWSSVNATLPRVNYVKAVDIFLMTSFCCVIFTLLEYTLVLNSEVIVHVFKRIRKATSTAKEDEVMLLTKTTSPKELNEDKVSFWIRIDPVEAAKEKKKKLAAKKAKEEDKQIERVADVIEKFARVFFPLAYLLFNIIYWSIYLS